MKIDIYIRDSQTGEAVIWHDPFDYEGWSGDAREPEEETPEYQIGYMFGDGNYACDCNRALFFQAAKEGKWPKWEDRDIRFDDTHTDDRFIIDKIIDRATGKIVYQDDAALCEEQPGRAQR